jgi:WD40 repeat protein
MGSTAENPSGARQVTSGDSPILNVTEAFDGRVLAIGEDGKVSIMNADGSQRSPFTNVRASGWLTSCGHFVVFTSIEPGAVTLMRVNRDGTDPLRLAAGDMWGVTCSPDGESVFYVSVNRPQKIWSVPVGGGSPREIADVQGDQIAGGLTISPDGKSLAYVFAQFGRVPAEGWNIVVSGIEGGPPRKILKAPNASNLAWSPDGSSLQYLLTKDGATNIWEQSLTGKATKQLTKFTSGEIFTFGWSLDRKSILMTRGSVSSDVVLLDFR